MACRGTDSQNSAWQGLQFPTLLACFPGRINFARRSCSKMKFRPLTWRDPAHHESSRRNQIHDVRPFVPSSLKLPFVGECDITLCRTDPPNKGGCEGKMAPINSSIWSHREGWGSLAILSWEDAILSLKDAIFSLFSHGKSLFSHGRTPFSCRPPRR
jgi:hypothetical protein